MRFNKEVVIFLSLLCYAQTVDAFVPISRTSTQLNSVGSTAAPKTVGFVSSRLYAVDDDDEDDYDDDDDDDEDEYEDEENPLGKGVDSVSWLPSVKGQRAGKDASSIKEGAEVLPLFPLAGFVYTPNTQHVLNIFEPRYRQMYSDILMNGTKRFVVATSHPTEQGSFAQTGVLFELEDLKEVSEQTADQIKYVCNHKVTGRVTIHKILNPEAWENRETYLKVEGTINDDSGMDDEKVDLPENDVYGAILKASKKGSPKGEQELKTAFSKLVDIQHEIEEDVRFTRDASETLAVKDGSGSDGLWQTVRLWQSFVDQRLLSAQNELQSDFQEKLQEFLKRDKGFDADEMPSAIGFSDLTPELQAEVGKLQKRMAVELQPLVMESSLTMQKILEANGHEERLQLVTYFMESETRRLKSKKTLKGIFSDSDDTKLSSMPPEEMISGDNESEKSATDESESSFFDEPDAFQ